MIESIWHTTDETPKPWVSIAFYVDGYLYDGYYESQFNQYGIFGADKVEKWCYIKELSSYIPSLETENKDLSDKIGKLETELERTRKALEIAVDALKSVRKNLCEMPDPSGATIFRMACESATTVKKALEQITALEQKD